MKKVLFVLETLAFWGMFFLVALIVGFSVPLKGLVQDITSTGIPLNVFAIYLLVSAPVFAILAIIDFIISHKNGITVFETMAIAIPSLVWTPYKGIDIRELFKFRKLGMSGSAIAYDIGIMLQRIIEMVIWWGVLVYAIRAIMVTPNCVVATTINAMEKKEIFQKAGMVLLAIIVINILGWIVSSIQSRIWKKQFSRSERYSKGTLGQHYFDKHPERIPSGCRACGGPYPECRSGCNLFDE